MRGILKVGVDVLATFLSSAGSISAQLGDAIANVAETSTAEWWQHIGFTSRPANGTKGKQGAQAVALSRGDRDVITNSRNTLSGKIYGSLRDGETALWSDAGQGRVLLKRDGSITLVTTADNTEGGETVSQQLRPNGITWIAPWGTLEWDAKGLRVKDASGAMLILGPPASTPPGLLSSVRSCARIVADATELLGNATCKIGIKGGTCAPIVVSVNGLPVVGTNPGAPSSGAMCSV